MHARQNRGLSAHLHVHLPEAEKEEADKGAIGGLNAVVTEAAIPSTRKTLLEHGRRRRLVKPWSCGCGGMVCFTCCCFWRQDGSTTDRLGLVPLSNQWVMGIRICL